MNSDSIAAAFQCVASPIWIVTSQHAGRHGGLAATMVMPASIVDDAPRLVMGLAKHHATHDLVQSSQAFAAHLISINDAYLVEQFGTQSSQDSDKFDGLDYRASDAGHRILTNVLAWFDCRVETSFNTGDRTVFLAEVMDGGVTAVGVESSSPLMTSADIGRSFVPEVLALMKQQRAEDGELDAIAIAHFRRATNG